MNAAIPKAQRIYKPLLFYMPNRLRVSEVDLLNRTLRLEPGTTKNREGREVTMTDAVYHLLCECVARKQPDEFRSHTQEGRSGERFSQDLAKGVHWSRVGQDVLRCVFCSSPKERNAANAIQETSAIVD
jgi:hypothetical protein